MTIMATTSRSRVIIEDEADSSNTETDSEVDTDSKEVESEHESEPDEEMNVENEDESDKDSNNSENVDDDDLGDVMANAGWADSIAKILKTNKPKGKKTLVLSKAKKLTDVRRTQPKPVGFEIEDQDGKRKREHIEASEVEEDKTRQPARKKRKELPIVRIKPNILEKDRERTLSKIATKGVVQLFNAVKKQQKDIDTKLKEAGPLEVKRDKVLKNIDKREFLNVLMGEKSRPSEKPLKNETVSKQNSSKESEGPTWGILRDDFMMGAKMKDWDKELEDQSESEVEPEIVESE